MKASLKHIVVFLATAIVMTDTLAHTAEFYTDESQTILSETPLFYNNCWSNPYDNSIATSSEDSCNDDCYGPYANGWALVSFSYLKTVQDGINQTFKGNTSHHSQHSSQFFKSHFDPDWDCGFGIAGGYNFRSYGFGLAVHWSHLKNNCNGIFWANEARWKIHYDTIDAEIAFELCSLPDFKIFPFGGIRIALIDEIMHVKIPSEITANIPFKNYFVKGPHTVLHFSGTGPRIGLAGELLVFDSPCGYDLKLLGSLAGNVLYGVSKNEISHIDFDLDGKRPCNRKHVWIGVIDAAAGASFTVVGVTMGLGCEYHRYFNFQTTLGDGDLQIYGGNVSFSVTF